MASLNGLEVKAVKYFPDHEGLLIPYGNLYYRNKKVGEFRYDSWGGPMTYNHTHKTITKEEVMKAFHEIVPKLGWHEFYDNYEILIEELIFLKKWESIFKKVRKDGDILILHHQDYTIKPFEKGKYLIESTGYRLSEQKSDAEIDHFVNQVLKEKNGKGAIHVFRSLEDFNW